MKFLEILIINLSFITFSSLAASEELEITYSSDSAIFQIESNQGSWGTTQEGPCNEYYIGDASGNFVATAKMQGVYDSAHFDLIDNDYNLIGMIVQEPSRGNRSFNILLPSRQKMGTAKMSFWDTKLTILAEEDQRVVATLLRSYLAKNWTLHVEDPEALKEKLLLYTLMTLTAFQPYYDIHYTVNAKEAILDCFPIFRVNVSENHYSPEEDFD